uniref:Uncharacterized protein n=1 Tax=Opuntia streptacantha TaxID=393608 RepID=A0A7C9AKZ9_OPUST
MAIIDSTYKLLEILASDFLTQPPLSHPIEQFTPLNVFHDEIYSSPSGHDLLKGNHIRVSYQPHDGDLPLDLLHHAGFFRLIFTNDLNCNSLFGEYVFSRVDLGKGALA